MKHRNSVLMMISIVIAFGAVMTYINNGSKITHQRPHVELLIPSSPQSSTRLHPSTRASSVGAVDTSAKSITIDPALYATNLVYRSVVATLIRRLDLEANQVYRQPASLRIRELLESRNLGSHELQIVMRTMVHQLVLDRWQGQKSETAMAEMKAKIGEREPDFVSGSLQEIYYRDQNNRRIDIREAAVVQLQGLLGETDVTLYDGLYELDIGSLHPPLLEVSSISVE